MRFVSKIFFTALLSFVVLPGMLSVFTGCSKGYVPKPVGYLRIDSAEGGYRVFDNAGFPLSFEISEEAVAVVDSMNKGTEWLNILYPRYNATVYCSYLKLTPDNMERLFNESRDLVYVHAGKSDNISAVSYQDTVSGVEATLYRLSGGAATPLQFTVSDGKNYLFRGALYFNSEVNGDSVAPVVDYIEADMERVIESLRKK